LRSRRQQARFRDRHLEAIEALVEHRSPLLVVQRTGWGKSAVYFVASRLLRDRGSGTRIIVSPLLAHARPDRGGIEAASERGDDQQQQQGRLERVERDLFGGVVDLLPVSSERFNNADFKDGSSIPSLAAPDFW
jgi:ATP-dependent DNA helicase RecQ